MTNQIKKRNCEGNKMNELGMTEFDFIASVDAGNGGINAASRKGDGTCHASHFSASGRVEISPEEFDDPQLKKMMHRVDLYKWKGRTYAYGDDVAYFRRHTIERNSGNLRYGEDAHQMYVAASLANMGVHGDVDVTLFLPPGKYNDQKETLIKAFHGQTHFIEVSTAEGVEYEAVIKYKNVRVLPEGIGVVFCNRYDQNGKPDDSLLNYLSGEVVFNDIGKYTSDVVVVNNGKFDPTAIRTYDDFGMNSQVIMPIHEALGKQNKDWKYILPEEIDFAIREGTYSFMSPSGQVVKFAKLYEKQMKSFADIYATEIIQKQYRGYEGMAGGIYIGGGSKGIRSYHAERYRTKVFSPEAIGNVDETEVNAIGGLRFVLFNYFWK